MAKFYGAVLLLCAALQVTGCQFQPPAIPLKGNRATGNRPYTVPWRPTNYDWVKTDWTTDDPKYLTMRRSIDGAERRGEINKQAIETCEAAYLKNPSDLSLFQWAYTAYKGRKSITNAYGSRYSYEKYQLMGRIDEVLAKSPLPYSREFARLRFLVETIRFPNSKITPVGEKLLASGPNDKVTQFYLAQLLRLSPILADRKQALKYAQGLVGDKPQDRDNHDVLADCYDSLWRGTHNRAYAEKAIAEYEFYLRTLPPSDEDYAMTQTFIKRIQADLKRGSPNVAPLKQ